MSFDLSIRDALVVDGSGEPPRISDVHIEGDRIARVGPGPTGKREIVAAGRALSPGFVDVHAHDDAALLNTPELPFKLLQGVTSVVIGNCGFSLAPLVRGGAEPPGNASLFPGFAGRFEDLAAYERAFSAARPTVNAASLIGHNAIRSRVMGDEERAPTSTELAEMSALLRRALEQGAVGFSTGLIYRPGRVATREEIIEVARPLAEFSAVYATHMRSEGDRLLESVEETLSIAEAVGCRAQISHHKSGGRRNWGKVKASLARVDAANAAGADVTLDAYPYVAGSGPMLEYFDLTKIDLVLAEAIQIASCPGCPAYDGRRLTEIASTEGIELGALVVKILSLPGAERTVAITFVMAEEDVETNLRHPRVMVGSDGLPNPEGRPHPRLYGTFPRVLGEYGRKRGLFSLEFAVAKMSSLPCERFGLSSRGRVAEGFFADLLLFDPELIVDRATFADPKQAPLGIELVLVNGAVASVGGSSTDVRAGRFLHFNK
ncbi:MAG TPA: D-aminoacylase [Polyangiaceae bacterium]|jgi:N-acyl-D-aspartate/D-glutamate deacylase|nr:D-aminoacylase [Polyangiaceae bacterium]